jgi:phage shock protein PspC (stress-responsive transcriptional regulator)
MSNDVGTTLRDMWETRPARPRGDRKVAGVAAAIARRYDIDPVLVRVGFAVSAVYGIGIALYLVCWMLLPGAEKDDPLDGAGPRTGTKPTHPAMLVLLAVLLLATGGIFWGGHGGFVLPVLAVGGLLFLLHRSRADKGIPGGAAPDGTVGSGAETSASAPWAPTASADPTGGEPGSTAGTGTAGPAGTGTAGAAGTGTAGAAGTTGAPSTAGAAGAAGAAEPRVGAPDPDAPTERIADPWDRGTPPEWDPLGAAPFAWDLPEPAGPEPEPTPVRRRSRVTPITLALALLGGGVAGAAVLLTVGLPGLPIVFATVLGILGLGLVIGSFRRGGRGIIPFALVFALLTWGAVAAKGPLESVTAGGVGDISVAPTTVAGLLPSYERGAGTVELDLRRLDLSVPPGSDPTPVPIAANVGMGTIEVTVPANADLTLRAHSDLGDVQYGTTDQGGTNAQLTVVDDLGADGVRAGRPLELDLRTGLGTVEVRRG